MSHTPRPWLITPEGQAVYALMPNPDTRSIRYGHPAEINRFYAGLSGDRSCPLEELRANARLIAAAPDLLAALEMVLEDAPTRIVMDDGHEIIIRAAIKKARGL